MLTFELVSPERKLASAEAEAVTIPGMMGDMTAMSDHAPFLTTMRPGVVVVRNGTSEDKYVVTGGFAEISGNVVSVLAEQATELPSMEAEWLDGHIAEARKLLDEASEERKQAALQRVNDFEAFKASL